MISKKALLIAVGIVAAMPFSPSLAADPIQSMIAQFDEMAKESSAELEEAKVETEKVAKENAQAEENLQNRVKNIEKLLTGNLAKKEELQEELKGLQKQLNIAYQANQDRLKKEREFNNLIISQHYQRVKKVNEAIEAMTKTLSTKIKA